MLAWLVCYRESVLVDERNLLITSITDSNVRDAVEKYLTKVIG